MIISVIIPTCNRNNLLEKCLLLLNGNNQMLDIAEYEIIVTDDSKSNEAKDLVKKKFSWVQWVEGPKRGPAANRNNGAKYANGEWLVFIDDDCLPDKNLLLNYKLAMVKYTSYTAFEGAILPDDWDLLKKDLAECPVNTEGNCFWSANICIKTSLFNKINGFDEQFIIAAQEDQQMKIDIEHIANQKIKFLQNCIVIHPVRFTTLRKQLVKIPQASRNFLIYALRNRRILGYETIFKFTYKELRLHTKKAVQSFRLFKTKSFALSVAWLFFGIPLNVWNYQRYKNLYKHK